MVGQSSRAAMYQLRWVIVNENGRGVQTYSIVGTVTIAFEHC